jgi:transcriptional regulator with XRE-family HTH domain
MKGIQLRVKELASARGWSDLELAGRSGVDVRVVRRMFAGDHNIYLAQLAKVSATLEVEVCELIAQTKDAKDGDSDK